MKERTAAIIVMLMCLFVSKTVFAASLSNFLGSSSYGHSLVPPFDIVKCRSTADEAKDPTLPARQALGNQKYKEAITLAQAVINQNQDEAKRMQGSLSEYPWKNKEEIFSYWPLATVSIALFVQGKSYLELGQKEKAMEIFLRLRKEFSYGQCWEDEEKYGAGVFRIAEYSWPEYFMEEEVIKK